MREEFSKVKQIILILAIYDQKQYKLARTVSI